MREPDRARLFPGVAEVPIKEIDYISRDSWGDLGADHFYVLGPVYQIGYLVNGQRRWSNFW